MTRRERSGMSVTDAHEAVRQFACKVIRQGETSDASMFSVGDWRYMTGKINVQFLVPGRFGVAEDLHEAFRVLAGHKLPRKI